MAKRQVVRIDEEKCDGCGECVPSCAEGAIQIIDGKARLLADNLCDGLGACLGECPQGAITVEEREADEYDQTAVARHLESLGARSLAHAHGHAHAHGPGAGCPGSRMLQISPPAGDAGSAPAASPSALRQWPVQLHLVSPAAPYFQGANLLLAADCTAFAMGDFHANFLNGKALAVACPKLDQAQEIYLDKLVALIDGAAIDTLTVMVMEVPCCSGLVRLAAEAAGRARRKVPVKRVVVGLEGAVRSEEWL
ncbi:MAG: 4Fe-4S binding protein [Gemmatimonadota bacterium]